MVERTRIRRDKPVGKDNLVALLKSYSETSKEVAALNKDLSSIAAEIEAGMKKAGIDSLPTEYADALIAEQFGRSTSVIDTKALQKVLKPEEFHECIDAIKGRCEKFLGTKELDGITTKTPGKSKGKLFSITVK